MNNYNITELVMGVVEKGFEYFDITQSPATFTPQTQYIRGTSFKIEGHPFRYTVEKTFDEEINEVRFIITCSDENPIYKITTNCLNYGLEDKLEEVLYYREITFKDFIVRDLQQVLEKLMNQIIKHSPVLDKPKDVTIHLQNGDI